MNQSIEPDNDTNPAVHLEGAKTSIERLEGAKTSIEHLERTHTSEVHLEGTDNTNVNAECTDSSVEHLGNAKISAEHLEHAKTSAEHLEHVDYPSDDLEDSSNADNVFFHRLKLKTSLLVGSMLLAFLASHIIARDVIGVTITGKIEPFLHLSPSQFEWSQAALFFTYAPFVIPFTFVFAKSNPRVFAGIQMFIWGLCCTLSGLSLNFAGLTSVRVIMGVEMSAALVVILHVIYESHGRFDGQFIFSCSWGISWFMVPLFALAAIALGLITQSKPGWAWMFFITGIAGCLQAPMVWKFLPDYFYHPRWISKHGKKGYNLFKKMTEQDYAEGNPVEPLETVTEGFFMALKDPIVWICSAQGLFIYSGVFGCYGELMTVTLNVLHYSPALGQCILWPMMVFGCFYCIAQNWLSRYYRTNYPFLLANYLFAIIGWALVLCKPAHKNYWIMYGGAWFIQPNMIAAMPTLVCWMGSNIQGRNRRLMSFAIFVFVTNWYGAIALLTFVSTAAPEFVKAAWINMSFMIAGVVFTVVIVGILKMKGGDFVPLL